METNSLSILPADYDIGFIIQEAGVANHYGYEAKDDGIHFRYQFDDYDAVQDAIAAYPIAYLSKVVPTKLAQASARRDELIAGFEFSGIAIILDLDTRSNLTAAALGLQRNPDLAVIEWSLGSGAFVALPRDTLLGLADAAFLHVQKLFAAHRVVADQIKAAQDINALSAIDIVNHEAWTA